MTSTLEFIDKKANFTNGLPPAGVLEKPKSVEVIGGDYSAHQATDGTWTILDVPIFAEHERKGIDVKFDRAWLDKAVLKAEQRYRDDKYMAPLHIRHHEGGANVERAGYVMPRKVKKLKYEGREVWAIFADLIAVPQEVYDRVKAKALPYRSVEILDIHQPEISSLALLSDEVPYFRFPNLTIGKEVSVEKFEGELAPALSHQSSENYSRVLFYFAGGPMPEDTKPEGKKDEKEVAAQEETPGEGSLMKTMFEVLKAIAAKLGIGAPAPEAAPEAQGPVEMKADEKKDEPKADEPKPEVKAAATEPAPVAMTAKTEEPKVEVKAVAVPDEVVSLKAENVALKAKYDALEARLKGQEKDESLKGKVKATLKDLASYNLGSGVEDYLLDIAKRDGEAALAVYADAVKKHGLKEPPKSFSGDLPVDEVYPAEVLTYSGKGPDTVAKAASFWQNYKALGDKVKHIALKDWIETQMNAEHSAPVGR